MDVYGGALPHTESCWLCIACFVYRGNTDMSIGFFALVPGSPSTHGAGLTCQHISKYHLETRKHWRTAAFTEGGDFKILFISLVHKACAAPAQNGSRGLTVSVHVLLQVCLNGIAIGMEADHRAGSEHMAWCR